MAYLATKIGDILVGKLHESIEEEILKAMGQPKVKLKDIGNTLSEARNDLAKVSTQITMLSSTIQLLNKEKTAVDAANEIGHFFDVYTRDAMMRFVVSTALVVNVVLISTDPYISKTDKITFEKTKEELRSNLSGVENQLTRFHNALIGNNSPFSLIAAVVDYYWDIHENHNTTQAGLYFGIVALVDKIHEFIVSTTHIQSTALRLVKAIYDNERCKLITKKASRFILEQSQLLRKLIPPSIDLSKDVQVDNFLIGLDFYFEVQNTSNKRMWLSSVYTFYERVPDSLWSPGYTKRPYIFPYVWNEGDQQEITWRKGFHWNIEREPSGTGFYILSGYNIRDQKYREKGESIADRQTPQPVNIRWEQVKVEEDLEKKEGKRPRYATRWEGEVVLFKIIMVRSKMKDDNTKIMLRFVDKDYSKRDDPREWFSNAAFADHSTYWYHLTRP